MAGIGAYMVRVVAVLLVARFVPGFQLSGPGAALWAALAIGLVNFLVRPVLQFLALPLTLLTFGLFSLVINGISLYLASLLVPGFLIRDLTAAVVGAVALAVVSSVLSFFVGSAPGRSFR